MNLLSKFSEGGWNVAYRYVPTGTILEERNTPFSLIPNTWRSWTADPFAYEHEGTIYIFAEIFDYLKRKASIGYTACTNGKWTKWKTVIDEPFHMSYPNVFSCNGQIYMVPETSADRTLRLYKAVDFPEVWQLEKILATDVAWVDTTFFAHDGRTCAITTDMGDLNDQKDILLCFDTRWNLVSREIISEKEPGISRSGGNFFEVNQERIRVTQDCREHYGNALVFSCFNPDTLKDTGMGDIFLRLEPKDIPISQTRKWTGLHTYSSGEKIEVVDIERNHYNLTGLAGRLAWKIRMCMARG